MANDVNIGWLVGVSGGLLLILGGMVKWIQTQRTSIKSEAAKDRELLRVEIMTELQPQIDLLKSEVSTLNGALTTRKAAIETASVHILDAVGNLPQNDTTIQARRSLTEAGNVLFKANRA